MRLALVVIKEHAGGAMQLGNNHTLGAVDDEGAVVGHQGDFPHVDFLLLDVLDGLAGGVLVVDYQTHLDPQGTGISNATQLALADIKHRRAEFVVNVFQCRVAAVADDREHRFKGRVQAVVAALLEWYALLGELPVRIELDRKQVWNIHHVRQFAEVLANTFFLSVRVCHQYSPACLASRRPAGGKRGS